MIMTTTRLVAVALLLAMPRLASAQTPPAQPASAPAQQLLTNAQLDALVSPIALYPDTLLSEVLMASTYPLEVVEADRWVQDNKNLKGYALKSAVDQQSWDDSVKSLTATPDVLDMMSNKLSWTQQLGDAVLAQQPDVMDAIQRLRTKAQANNKLSSNKQQTVTTQQQGSRQVIVIAPTDPNTVYVPYYDPAVVYGPWPDPAYPPYYWPAPGYIAGGVIATGIAFGAGYALGRWASGGGGCCWGGGVNWGNNNMTVNRNINNIGNNNNWTHNPAHRQGVRYSNANVAAKFGGTRANISGGAQNRMDFRGRSGQQVLQPGGGGNRPNIGAGVGAGAGAGAGLGAGAGAGARPGGGGNAGNRPSGGGNAGNRPSGGANAGNRPSGGGGNRGGGNRAATVNRPSGGNNAMANISSGRTASLQSARGQASLGGGGPRGGGGGGGFARGGGGGGGRGGGGGGRGGGGGGRRSDIRLKHDITLLGHLDNGIGFYRFIYNGGNRAYVGVMAQEVETVRPDAVAVGRDGYLRVFYDKISVKFQTYDDWVAAGARIPDVR